MTSIERGNAGQGAIWLKAGRLVCGVLASATIMVVLAPAAYAAGSGMPWEAPLERILESVQGPVAKIVAVIIIITTGLSLAFGETSGGFRRLIQIDTNQLRPGYGQELVDRLQQFEPLQRIILLVREGGARRLAVLSRSDKEG